jgi:hypothetical protein
MRGTGGTDAGVFGDTSNSTGSGVNGVARSAGGGYGVAGSCDSVYGVGVAGASANGTGVLGTSGFGAFQRPSEPVAVYGHGEGAATIGGVFTGGRATVRLLPADGPGAPSTGTHGAGELVVDSQGHLFYCSVGESARLPEVTAHPVDGEANEPVGRMGEVGELGELVGVGDVPGPTLHVHGPAGAGADAGLARLERDDGVADGAVERTTRTGVEHDGVGDEPEAHEVHLRQGGHAHPDPADVGAGEEGEALLGGQLRGPES